MQSASEPVSSAPPEAGWVFPCLHAVLPPGPRVTEWALHLGNPRSGQAGGQLWRCPSAWTQEESGGFSSITVCIAAFTWRLPPNHRPDPSHRQRGREKEGRKQNQEIKTLRAATINI